MRLRSATVFALEIPFVESFRHSAHARHASDSVVIRVVDDGGIAGYGEGAARPYVTGETPDGMVEHLARDLWPGMVGVELPDPLTDGLGAVDAAIPKVALPGVVAPNAARCALELAVVDCALRASHTSVGALLPPVRRKVTYSGVISSGSPEAAARTARQMRLVGVTAVKLKVGAGGSLDEVAAAREALGPGISLRLDANGAWDLEEALRLVRALEPFAIASIEQPLPRDAELRALRALREASPIPLMADESLVTRHDAAALLAEGAVDLFNVRVSKCGGLHGATEIARLAADAGVGVQVGSQVGETSILSAAGRHLAAWLPEVAFVEGSYGTLLLTEDVSVESVRFGHGGQAPILDGPGLGVEVVEERLRRHARRVVELTGPDR